jgi:hypothetical protein
MKRKSGLWFSAAFLLAAAVPAGALAQDLRPVFKLGYDFGGDTLVTALFTDGSTKSIKANEGLFMGVGASILNGAKNLEGEVSISYKFQTISASNGDIQFTRVPLDALFFYRQYWFRVGGGLTYHMSPKVEGSGVVGGLNVNFKDALGAILQADYLFGPTVAVGLRYTMLEYKLASGAGGSARSDGFGLLFTTRF